jgi:ABC-type uncharacterized transport system auxiliary subunit
MKKLMAPFIVLALSACGSLPKPGPQAALYDFGIPSKTAPIALPVRLAHVQGSPGLEGGEMRYRLAYKNPAQLYAYTESRWVSPPDRLVQRRIERRLETAGTAACALNVTVEAFDQVFDTPASSHAVVQLRAMLVRGGGRQAAVQTTLISAERAAASADAQGGVAAIDRASEEAVMGMLEWVKGQDCK